MQHADKLIERIIFLDGNPNMQTLESLLIGKTVKEVLDRDLKAEMAAQALYRRCGFVVEGRRRRYYASPVEDALLMSVSLGSEA